MNQCDIDHIKTLLSSHQNKKKPPKNDENGENNPNFDQISRRFQHSFFSTEARPWSLPHCRPTPSLPPDWPRWSCRAARPLGPSPRWSSTSLGVTTLRKKTYDDIVYPSCSHHMSSHHRFLIIVSCVEFQRYILRIAGRIGQPMQDIYVNCTKHTYEDDTHPKPHELQ